MTKPHVLTTHHYFTLTLSLGSLLSTSTAFAEDGPKEKAAEQQEAAAEQREEAAEKRADVAEENQEQREGGDKAAPDRRDKNDMMPVEDHSDANPAPPGGAVDEDDMDGQHPVVKGAGQGSEISYATRGVVELGGLAGIDVRDELFDLTIAPTVGYFIIDRLELSLIPLLRVRTLDDNNDGVSETNVRFAGILEPSFHVPFSNVLYGFVGLGLGVTYEEGPGADFLMRPVLGMDIVIGRSGILKPAGFLDVGVGNGAIGGGAQAAFSVMF